MNSDPLRKFFMANSPYTVIPIASAGNFKWKRPFFPAQWPEVLSVSATQNENTDLWPLSNNGEIWKVFSIDHTGKIIKHNEVGDCKELEIQSTICPSTPI